ncbi:UNVERIFIED_CONTAM: hypothetical protein GTU68_022737 [Idotea baltica]|nr:hypothetical protein [Idotea baltica]
MLHMGHLSILQRAKALGDYLVVGVTSEDYDRSRGKLNVSQSTKVRVQAVEKLNFVDKVIIERHKNQKPKDIVEYSAEIFAIGDDWVGKFDYLMRYCQVEYLPRTKGISSTQLRHTKFSNVKIGVIGTGRIAKRFVHESSSVSNVKIHSVMSRDMDNVTNFMKETGIEYGFNTIEELIGSGVDAVYIASPHQNHYEQAKIALSEGKHVLCEKPIVLKKDQLKELFEIAKERDLILLEAIKTAFFPAFGKVLEEVKKGKIGDVKEVRSTFTKLIGDTSCREWTPPHGGATNELASYPLLLARKILGKSKSIHFYDQLEYGVDLANKIVCRHKNDAVSISSVAIGSKAEGSAVISGTDGYIYIPAPWWLTKEFYIRYEDPNNEHSYHYDVSEGGIKYEISEFISCIQRKKNKSKRLTPKDMLSINKIIAKYNEKKCNKTF